MGQLPHWPHPSGGASSSRISTAAARSPPAGAYTGRTVGAAVAAVVTAAAAVPSYCGSVAAAVPCGGSLATAVLPVARDALDERRLMGTDASDLSALASARAGTVGATCEHEYKKLSSSSSKLERLGEGLLTSRWRSPASSSSRARRALRWWPPSPLQHSQTLPRTAQRRALLRPPQASAPLPPLRLLVRGRWIPPLRGPASVAFFFLFLYRRRVFRSRLGRESLLLAQPVLLILLFPALWPPDPLLLLACCPLLHPSLRRTHGRPGSGRGRVGPRRPQSPSAKNDCQNHAGTL
jgi:hypothetical protein